MKNTLTLIIEKWGVSQVYSNIDTDYLEITTGDIPERVDKVLIDDGWALKTDRFPVAEGRWVSVYEKISESEISIPIRSMMAYILIAIASLVIALILSNLYSSSSNLIPLLYAILNLPTITAVIWSMRKIQ